MKTQVVETTLAAMAYQDPAYDKEIFRNPSKVQPEIETQTFTPKANYYVRKGPSGSFQYFFLSGASKSFDAATRNVVSLASKVPLLQEGYVCLTGKRVVKVSVDDIIRGRIIKSKVLTSAEVQELISGRRQDDSSSPVGGAGTSNTKVIASGGKAIQDDDDQGPGEISWDEERSAADMVMEEQMLALLYTQDTQALRRIKDTAYTRQLIESSAVSDPDEDTGSNQGTGVLVGV